jgi:putative glutamine amidotransferase
VKVGLAPGFASRPPAWDNGRVRSKRPLIGVSASFFHPDPGRALYKGKTLLYAEQSLFHWVMSGGAVPVLLPTAPPRRGEPGPGGRIGASLFAADMVEQIDALLLQGGADMSPRSYGAEPLRPEWQGDALRDAYEIELLNLSISAGKPVLGVCRGAQVINVALGGTLYQDIELEHEHEDKRVHRMWEIYDQHGHDITVEPGSWLERWYGGEARRVRVNSVHHQAIRQLGCDLVVEARSIPDGIVEAVRYQPPAGSTVAQVPWVYGVQWHPEFATAAPSPSGPQLLDSMVLLEAFLEAVQASRS